MKQNYRTKLGLGYEDAKFNYLNNSQFSCFNDTNDPPPTSQPTDDNPLTDLQDRQRAPLKQLSRCLENRTRIESPMSEISDEEVDYGSYASNVDLVIAPGSWSPI